MKRRNVKQKCVVSKLFHYKDRSSKFFVICALKFSSIFPYHQTERERRERKRANTSVAASYDNVLEHLKQCGGICVKIRSTSTL